MCLNYPIAYAMWKIDWIWIILYEFLTAAQLIYPINFTIKLKEVKPLIQVF